MTASKEKKPPAPAGTKRERDETELVTVAKGGESLDVHPSCVEAHRRAGWVEV